MSLCPLAGSSQGDSPSQVMIYTIDRETPDHDLQKATHEELDRIVELIKRTGIPATASY